MDFLVNLETQQVLGPPSRFGDDPDRQNHLPAEWASSGLAALMGYFGHNKSYTVDKGSALVFFQTGGSGGAPSQSIPAIFSRWPATWHLLLRHAPSGRVGNLWSVITPGNYIVQHNGDQRTQRGDQADHVAGADGTVMIASAGENWHWNGSSWTPLITLPSLIQVAVGDANTVWRRDTSNHVYRFDATGSTFSRATLVGAATHLAANADGTLWHCNQANPLAYRFISEATASSEAINAGLPSSVTGVQKEASNGFGAAHCLYSRAMAAPTCIANDSLYVFKTSQAYTISAGTSIEKGLGNLYLIFREGSLQFFIVALDGHTGREVARTPPTSTVWYTGLVFDPLHELVYATVYTGSTTPGQLLALDAHRKICSAHAHIASEVTNSPQSSDASPLFTASIKQASSSRNLRFSSKWRENTGSEDHPHAIVGAHSSPLTSRSAFVSRPNPINRLNGDSRGKES